MGVIEQQKKRSIKKESLIESIGSETISQQLTTIIQNGGNNVGNTITMPIWELINPNSFVAVSDNGVARYASKTDIYPCIGYSSEGAGLNENVIIQISGIVTLPITLIPNKYYYVNSEGSVGLFSEVYAINNFLQKIGFAISTSQLVLMIGNKHYIV